jgi:anthranilate phosphoribosyltransferase
MKLSQALKVVYGDEELSRDEARDVFAGALSGEADPVLLGAFLIALGKRGESPQEILGAAEALREAMLPFEHSCPDAIDTCGTGGDGLGSFNVSTAAAIIACAAGAKVIKHGNRSITSKCGSADLLEAAGIPLELSPEASRAVLEEVGITFLFAPHHHPAMRHAAPVRKALGIPTIFNLLGPLCNPGRVKRQLLGIADGTRLEAYSEVLAGLGHERALVVHGGGGADELTLEEGNRLASVGEVESSGFDARELGLTEAGIESARGGDSAKNLRLLNTVLAGEEGPLTDMVLLNTAASLVVAGIASDAREGLEKARKTLTSGAGREKLRQWKETAEGIGA